jgi:hypothetical protein
MNANHDTVTAQAGARAVARNEVLPGISKPKVLFMLAAGISFLASVSLFFTGDHERGIFVGIWVPSILSAGALLLGRDHRD